MKCVYHSADFDGKCAGAILKMKYPYCEMIGMNYGDSFPWHIIEKGEVVFMVDFGLQPFEDMIKLNEMVNLIWIDHHSSAIKEAEKNNFKAGGGKLEIGKAGCELTWGYIYPYKPMPKAVKWIGRYDVWDLSDDCIHFQYGIKQFEKNNPLYQFALWQNIFNDDFATKIKNDGKKFYDYEKVQNAKYAQKYAYEVKFDGFKAVCVNKGMGGSPSLEAVYSPSKHDLMIVYVKLNKNQWSVSLYSDKDFVDCGTIAKKYGGGGHKGAAGFQCDKLLKEF